jgi:hypothetical protein
MGSHRTRIHYYILSGVAPLWLEYSNYPVWAWSPRARSDGLLYPSIGRWLGCILCGHHSYLGNGFFFYYMIIIRSLASKYEYRHLSWHRPVPRDSSSTTQHRLYETRPGSGGSAYQGKFSAAAQPRKIGRGSCKRLQALLLHRTAPSFTLFWLCDRLHSRPELLPDAST